MGGKGILYCPISGIDCVIVILMMCWESSKRMTICCGCEDFLSRTFVTNHTITIRVPEIAELMMCY